MPTDETLHTGLAKAPADQKLAGYFGISVDVQRRIGTFIILYSMIEQQLEFVLLQRATLGSADIFPTDKMTVSERLKALRALAGEEPELAPQIGVAVDLGELLTEARHTVAHGAPIAPAKLEKNRSWLGEQRKRPFASLLLGEPVLDAAAAASEILFRLLGSIGAYLAGEQGMAAAMAPSAEEMAVVDVASTSIRKAMSQVAENAKTT